MSTRAEREADTKTKDKHQKILKDLMARPENRRCADCRKKGTLAFLALQCLWILGDSLVLLACHVSVEHTGRLLPENGQLEQKAFFGVFKCAEDIKVRVKTV